MKTIQRLAVLLLACVAGAAGAQVVIVAGAASPAHSLTAEQAASIFLGKRSRLPGVGQVMLVDQAPGQPLRDRFYTQVTGKSPAEVAIAWSRLTFSGKAFPPRQAAGSAEVKRLLAAHPEALGYIEKSAVDDSVKVLLALE